MLRPLPLVLCTLLPLGGAWLAAQEGDSPPGGPFGLSLVTTESGRPVEIDRFHPNRTCSLCHKAQRDALRDSLHSMAHRDPFYRKFAELAKVEAGEEVYVYCSGCHAPTGVVSDLTRTVADSDLPDEVTDGVTCDACHQVIALTGEKGPWGEPGNASLVLAGVESVKFGPLAEIDNARGHDGRARDFYQRSEYCASCHTVIHPVNGLRIEHTYDEWKKSVYAEKGIQCQDCHMRSVEDAVEVARTLTALPRPEGPWARKGQPRPISVHSFVGGNVDAAHLFNRGEEHAAQAEKRLRSAATLGLEARGAGEGAATFAVVVTNVAAGHSLPTSLTELREMWVHLRVTDDKGAVVFESGDLDEHGEIREGAIRFGAHTVDAEGVITCKPWEAVGFAWKRLVPARGSTRDEVRVPLPAEVTGPLAVDARLLYRIAPPHAVDLVLGEEAFVPRIVEMAAARLEIEVP